MKRLYTLALMLMGIIAAHAAQTIDISITGDYNMTYYSDSGDWFFGAKDDSGNYTLRLDYTAPQDNPYGTFTLSDIIADNSCVRDYTSGSTVDHAFTDGTTFTMTREDSHLKLTGTFVCDNGVTYKVTGDMLIEDNITIEGTELLNANYSTDDDDWYIRFKDDKYRVTLDLKYKDGGFANTWTEADKANDIYNMVTRLSDNYVDHFVSFNITTTMPDGVTDPTTACEITGTAVGESGKTYILHMKKDDVLEPTSTENITVTVETAEYPSTSTVPGGCYFLLKEKKLLQNIEWELAIKGLEGTFTQEDMVRFYTCRKNNSKSEIINLDHGTATLTPNTSAQTVHVKADLIMKNAVEYIFEFDAPISIVDGIKDINATANATYVIKALENGKVVIRKDGKTYNVQGMMSDK